MDSLLNPDALEFCPDLKKVTQGGFLTIKQLVKTSKIFTTQGQCDTIKTLTAFKSVASELAEYVSLQIDEIIDVEIPDILHEGLDDQHYNEEQVVYSSKNIFKRLHLNLEELYEMDKLHIDDNYDQNTAPMEINQEIGENDEEAEEDEEDEEDEEYEEEEAASTSNPQDDLANVWRPKLFYKPNSLVEFELRLIYMDGKPVGYEHPYKYELNEYEPPSVFMEPEPEPIPFPPPLKNTNYTFVNTEGTLEALLRHLQEVDELAVDVEHHNYRTYQGITCLIQITTFQGDYIIDALQLKEKLHKLNYAFTDPKKTKILHGAEMDVLWLQRDLGVYIVGLFDTHQAALELKLPFKSLKTLLQLYCRVNTDKTYQTADWRVRPLPREMIKYARMDTHYLLYIWKRMKNELLGTDGADKKRLHSVFMHSRRICESTYKFRVINDTSHLGMYHRSDKDFSPRQLVALKMLYEWRDTYAKQIDESPAYVLPNKAMLALAESLPKDYKTIRDCCHNIRTDQKKNVAEIHKIIQRCLEMKIDTPLPDVSMGNELQRLYHMLDLPQSRFSDDEESNEDDFLREPDDCLVEPSTAESKTSFSNVNIDQFFSPYLRYMKSEAKQKEETEDLREKREKTIVDNPNKDDALAEFTPIYRKKETDPNSAKVTETEEVQCDEDSGGEFQIVTRRKRNARSRRMAHALKQQNEEVNAPSCSSKNVFYKYTKPNYQSFYSVKDKSKSNSKKHK